MAEIVTKSTSPSRRLSTRVDMTPMVDLGFLLITFFMLTTTMMKNKTMEINMPDKSGGHEPSVAHNTVTFLLGKDDKIHMYRGVLEAHTRKEVLTYKAEGLRKRLLELKQQIGNTRNRATGKLTSALIVVIKAEDESKYQNVVDVLDEINICDVERFALVDITPKDIEFIKRP
jgi:biopolymer transport protein ExbD